MKTLRTPILLPIAILGALAPTITPLVELA